MKNLKHSSKRWLALLMVLMMCLSMVNLTAFATTEDPEAIPEEPEVTTELGETEEPEVTTEPEETEEPEEEEPEEPETEEPETEEPETEEPETEEPETEEPETEEPETEEPEVEEPMATIVASEDLDGDGGDGRDVPKCKSDWCCEDDWFECGEHPDWVGLCDCCDSTCPCVYEGSCPAEPSCKDGTTSCDECSISYCDCPTCVLRRAILYTPYNSTIKLTEDVELKATLVFEGSGYSHTLDLNGYTLTAPTGKPAISVGVYKTAATLILVDSNETGRGGQIVGNASNNGVVYVNGGVFTMTGGTITGNVTPYNGAGGGVYVNSGTFNMSGGAKITGNSANSGGGVCVKSGASFNMTGGEISGNTATSYGGDVYVAGNFTMSGGKITVGSENPSGVCVDGGVFTMSGGTISGGSANVEREDALVYVNSGTFTMESGTIEAETGRAVSVDATFIMENGTITAEGNAVYVSSWGGNLTVNGGSIESKRNGAVAGDGDIVIDYEKAEIKSAPFVAKVYDSLDECDYYYYDLASAFWYAMDFSTVTLLADVTLDSSLVIDGEVGLDLNGHTISSSTDKTPVIWIDGGALTLTAENGGALSHSHANTKYGVVQVVNRGTFTMESGTITSAIGHGVYADGKSTVTINGGTITIDNTKILQGFYAIKAHGGSKVYVNGGTLNGGALYINNASGGVIYAEDLTLSNSGEVVISGGTLIAGGKWEVGEANYTGQTGYGIVLWDDVKLTIQKGENAQGNEPYIKGLSAVQTVGQTKQNATVTIHGGTLEALASGIFLPTGTLSIDGGSITGETGSGIVAYSKSVTISGGTITAKGSGTIGAGGSVGDLRQNEAAAVTITRFPNRGGYSNGDIKVSISGGTLIGNPAVVYAFNHSATNGAENDVAVKATAEQNAEAVNRGYLSVTGGQFSDTSAKYFVGEGHTVALNGEYYGRVADTKGKDALTKVEDLNIEELAEASTEELAEALGELEETLQQSTGITVTKVVADDADVASHEDEITIAYASLNAVSVNDDIKFTVGAAEDQEIDVSEESDDYKTETAVLFSMKLEINGEEQKELKVPMVITLPVPDGFASTSTIKVLHYHDANGDGTVEPDEVKTIDTTVSGGNVTFVVTGFSDFALVEIPASITGGNGGGSTGGNTPSGTMPGGNTPSGSGGSGDSSYDDDDGYDYMPPSNPVEQQQPTPAVPEEPVPPAPAEDEPVPPAPAEEEPVPPTPDEEPVPEEEPAPVADADEDGEPAEDAPAADVPAEDEPEVEIPDANVPLASGSDDARAPEVEIPDEDVPLSGISVEETTASGSSTVLWVCVAVGGCAIIGVGAWLILKKRVRN